VCKEQNSQPSKQRAETVIHIQSRKIWDAGKKAENAWNHAYTKKTVAKKDRKLSTVKMTKAPRA
jgi:hypothetical protein